MADLAPESIVGPDGYLIYRCLVCDIWLNGRWQFSNHLGAYMHQHYLRRRELQMRQMEAEAIAQREREARLR